MDKSVVSRWLSGHQAPSGENLARLTALVATQRPGISLLDWEADLETFAAKLGVGQAEPASSSANPEPFGRWLPEAVLNESRAMTELRGDAYEGFWRTTRPAIGMPGRFIHDFILIRRGEGGHLSFRLRVEDMVFEGWTFLTQTQLFSFGADAKSGLFLFSIYNAVMRHKAYVLDGLTLTVQRTGGGSPVAGGVLIERIADLSGDPEADEATYEALAARDRLAPEGSVPEDIRNHIFRNFGPDAMAAGGEALLTMPFATSRSTGPPLEVHREYAGLKKDS